MTEAEVAAFVHQGDAGRAGTLSVGVKDLFRVDGMPTRAGSRLPGELFEGPESRVVTDLRRAGATIVGKTAMDEFAYCEPPATRNPRDLSRTPGGSSGGSAAAVAAGMYPLAVGSQTLKSVIVPASYCGVVGYVTTYARVPMDGVPLSPSFDTVGFLAADVEILQEIAPHTIPGWRNVAATGPPILGIPDSRWGSAQHDEGWDAFDRHVDQVRRAGLEIRPARLPWLDDLDRWAKVIQDLLHGELARVHADWFTEHAASYRPRTRQAVERGRAVTDIRIAECRADQQRFATLLHEATAKAGVDAWLCPSSSGIAPRGYDNTGSSWMTAFWSFAGWPAVNLPIFDGPHGLPHGLQLVAPAGQDEELLGWARELSRPRAADHVRGSSPPGPILPTHRRGGRPTAG